MEITVTAKHIKKGVPHRLLSCPIALAMSAAGIELPSVGRCEATFYRGVTKYWTYLPLSAREFIYKFDVGLPVEPFTFEIEGAKQ